MSNVDRLLEEDIKNFEILEVDADLERAEKNNTRASNWVGTWNNPTMTDDGFYNFLDDLYQRNILEYAIFQRERGEENGTEHLQFFVSWKNAQYFKTIKQKEYLPYGSHFKPMYSTKTRCRTYCSKEDTRISEQFYEIGEFVEERGRSDLAKIMVMIDEGIPLRTISKIYPTQCIMYSRQLKEYEQDMIAMKEENNFRQLQVYYIWGKTGTGKTRHVMEKYGYSNVYRVKFYDSRAFDKYNNQNVILFDEFRSGFKITDMLHYLDGYPLEFPCRFHDKVARYTIVYIITNIPIEQQYPTAQLSERTTFSAFKRRITKIYNFDDAFDRNELINGKSEQIGLLEVTDKKELEKIDNAFKQKEGAND